MADIDVRPPRQALSAAGCLLGLALAVAARPAAAQTASTEAFPTPSGSAELYRAACASCHGADGAGAEPSAVAFEEALPDFTECSFATREPDADWVAIAHEGGPVRGFSRMMPAFGAALSKDQLQRAMDHLRTFCGSDSWPRGELNLPRALVTEKAYPEDEAVLESAIAVQGAGSVQNQIVYERRFGARNQFEVVLPFGWATRGQAEGRPEGEDTWVGGIGDIALGVKRAMLHSLRSGSILSLAGEFILPTGNEADGLGKGTVVFEPFLSYGQLLPASSFFQFQGGVEIPFDTEKAENEAFWRATLGTSLVQGRWGRTWSPMVEVLAKRELAQGEPTHWDLLPQLQVTLNARQHVRLNVGVRIPLDDADVRSTEILFYFLWDWFDGGLSDGW